MSSPNGQPGNRTVAAKFFTRKSPSIRSIDTYVDLRGGYENILFGERRGGGCGPLFFNQGYARKKKEEEAGGRRVGLRNRIATSMAVKVILALQ